MGKILKDHGLYSNPEFPHRFTYVIKLSDTADIMEAQSGESVDGYSLENLELEYETIDNKNLANDIKKNYMEGRTLSYEHVSLLRSTVWNKSTTLVNETINVPKNIMKGVLMLFREKDETDPEKYMYPNIVDVKITIKGVHNMIYSQKLPNKRMFEEAQRLFENDMENPEMKALDFYKDKYALWIDLRTTYSKNTFGEGMKLVETQNGILLEINKEATTKDVECHIFILSDASISFSNGRANNPKV